MTEKSTSILRPPKTAQELLDMYFLDVRSHLLETAAFLDRCQRASGGDRILEDSRIAELIQAIEILKDDNPNRAEKFLLHFSEND